MGNANISIEEFEALTDRVFSYLVTDFGYTAMPAEWGGRFDTGLVRNFVRDDLTIGFIFGDADSSHLCSIYFEDGKDRDVRQRYMIRGLSILLLDRKPGYQHKSSRDLTDDDSIIDAISEYALLLKEFGEDAIRGDFSGFPTLVYLLVYTDKKRPAGEEFVRNIGVFSTLELAELALSNRREMMGHIERPNGYEIWRVDVDPKTLIRPEDFLP